ncbi:Avr1-1 [Ascochyta lentis]|nr:Avr1-1 [Ascochyta lentis]
MRSTTAFRLASLLPLFSLLVSNVSSSPVEEISTLSPRRDLCCALAVDARFIGPVCVYIANCGAGAECNLDENEKNWCHSCQVAPDYPDCNHATWPPVKVAPITHGGRPEEVSPKLVEREQPEDSPQDEHSSVDSLQKRYISLREINTGGRPNSWFRSIERVTWFITRSASGALYAYCQNTLPDPITWVFTDRTTGFKSQEFTTPPFSTSDAVTWGQVVVKGGDIVAIKYA